MGDLLNASVIASAMRLATPYIYAGLGETFAQRSGVLNLGVDGIMLMGAFAAYYAFIETQSLLLAVLIALVVGTLMGLATAFVSVTLKAEQGISGIGVYLFGLGLSELLFQQLIGTPTTIRGFQEIDLPVLSDIEFLGIGQIFFQHTLLVYLAFFLVPICAYVMNKTPLGLQIRAVGQNPEAADAMGVNVTRVRYLTVTFGGLMAGLAGASLSLALVRVFQQNITAGQGFIAVALVYFGGWRPYGILAGAMLFSLVNALQLQISTIGMNIPSEFALMAPYIVTILVLILAARRHEKPTALTKPYERGE